MSRGNLRIIGRRHDYRTPPAVAHVVRPVRCERLESRRLLTTYSYVVPPGHSAAYLQADRAASGRVQVRLDDQTTGIIGHSFVNTSGMDVIDCGANPGF